MCADDDRLTPMESAVLDAIIDGREAWSSASAIADATSCDLADILIALNTLEFLLHLVDAWPHPQLGALYSLSPLGAERFGVVIVDDGDGCEVMGMRWGTATARSTRVGARAVQRTEDHAALLEQAPDRRQPDPAAIVAELDYLESLWRKVSRGPTDRLPWPTVLSGFANPVYLPIDDFDTFNPDLPRKHWRPTSGKRGLTVFPKNGQNIKAGRRCQAGCRMGHQEDYEACPRCSRWGLDGVLTRLRKLEKAINAAA